MNKILFVKWIAALYVCAVASCATPTNRTSVPMSARSVVSSKEALADSIHAEVNSYRRRHGAKSLQRHPGLDRLAHEHCEFLRKNRGTFRIHGKNVSHSGFKGRAMAARRKFHMSAVGENVVAAQASGGNAASTLVSLWTGAHGHERNMRQAWTHAGIGVVIDDDGMIFATQLFGTR